MVEEDRWERGGRIGRRMLGDRVHLGLLRRLRLLQILAAVTWSLTSAVFECPEVRISCEPAKDGGPLPNKVKEADSNLDRMRG